MFDSENIDFHPKYVNPYYGGLIGFNFTREEVVSNSTEFLISIQGLREQLSNEDILTLLNHNWRPSKVGAWIIGLCEIKELEKDLIEYLKTRPNHSEHVIINLTLFNTDIGRSAINKFVMKQLDEILNLTKEDKEYKAFDLFESNSVVWGFNAIKYLDSINNTKNFEILLNSSVWHDLKMEWHKISRSNPSPYFHNQFIDCENKDLGFIEAFELIKKRR